MENYSFMTINFTTFHLGLVVDSECTLNIDITYALLWLMKTWVSGGGSVITNSRIPGVTPPALPIPYLRCGVPLT